MFIAEDEVSGLDMFIPGIPEIIWSLIVIVLLAIAFYKIVLPKMGDVFAGRAEKIEGEIARAAKQKAEAEQLHADYTAEIKNAKVEASEIKDAARVEGSQIVADARKKATDDAELIIKNAKRAVDSERKAAEAALKKQVGSLAMAMTQKMLRQGVDNDERQSKLIDNSLDRLEGTLSDSRSDLRSGNNARNNRKDRRPRYHKPGTGSNGSAHTRQRRRTDS